MVSKQYLFLLEADPLAPAHIPRPAATPPLVTKPSKVTPPRQVVLSTAGNPPPSRTVAHRAVQPARAPKTVAGRMPPTATPQAKMTTVTQNGKNPPGRLAFPDCKIRDLPFFPVKSTLLRPCNLAPKDSTQASRFYLERNGVGTLFVLCSILFFVIPAIFFDPRFKNGVYF